MKKKFWVTCGILTIGATLFSNSVFAVPGTVTANSVRIRKEASTSSEVISLAVQGEKVNVIGKEDDWYKVEFEDVTGYISSSFVDTDFEESGNTSSSSNESSSNNNGDIEHGESNAQKPEENQSQSPEQNQPQNPEQNGNNGDNNEANLPEVPSNQETPSSSNTSNTNIELGSKIKVEKEVSVRFLPNFSSKVTSNVATGTEVTILDQLNNWVKFTDGNVTGWGIKNEITGETKASSGNQPSGKQPNSSQNNSQDNQSDTNQESQNTKSDQSTQTGSTASSGNKSGTINVDRAVIRKSPDGETVDVLVMDTDVEIIGEEGDWYKINSEDYKGVYIAKRLVKVK